MPFENYDAILLVSFGGPEKPEHVMPFLENVLRGRPVPRERMLQVAEHYYHFGGVSPLNAQCRDLLAALRTELDAHGISLPLYWGNRNWHPLLVDTVRQMKQDGVRRALAYVTSGFSCYSGCRQYRENIAAALQAADANEMQVGKLRVFYNHPDFIAVLTDRLRQALDSFEPPLREQVRIAFTAHSIPATMADTSDYVQQLQETCRLAASSLALPPSHWRLVYQSRSGRPQDPWLEPDILDWLRDQNAAGVRNVVIAPVGFLSDHMEVLYDLDDEARKLCELLNIRLVRAGTPGHDPRFVGLIRKLIEERIAGAHRECVGQYGPSHDVCPDDCCPPPLRTRPVAETR